MATVTGLSAVGGSEDDPPKDEQVIEDAIRGSAGRKRVSLSRLAKDAHVQRQTIYNWFIGVAPEPETWGRVAARLDLPPLDQLLTRRRATQTPDPLVNAIDRQTDMLKAVLSTLIARLPPGEPETSGEAGLDEGVRRGQEPPNGTTPGTPPRLPQRRAPDGKAGRG